MKRAVNRRRCGFATLGFCLLGLATPALALDGPMPGAVSASKLKLPDAPGSVHGLADDPAPDVFNAQINYSVPIDLPDGPAGFGPALALGYSAALGASDVGVGWKLETIHLRRTLRHGVPSYTDADELELVGIEGGGRLVPGSNANEYWLEGHGTRVRAVRRQNSFEITDASGTHYFLGQTAQARLQSGNRIAAWFVEWILNVAGQEIRYSYRQETGQIYPREIVWGPPLGNGRAFKTVFTYGGRPDVILSFATGFGVQTGLRLQNIEVFSFGESLRRYDLRYADEIGDDRFSISRLHSLEMRGRNGQGTLPKLTFGYAGFEIRDTELLPGADGWEVSKRGVSFADVDGDGAADLLRLEAGNHEWRKSRGTAFGGERPMTGASNIELEVSTLMDLDGDARAELVYVVNDTWRAYKVVDENWQPLGEWPGTAGLPIHDGASALADVNGDGRTDVIRGRTGGIAVNFNSKTGMGPIVSLPRISGADLQVEPGADGVRFLDMNGDGLADVAWMTDSWIKIFLGRGDGTFVPFDRVDYPWGTAALDPVAIQLADLNRDGLIDLVRIVNGQAQWFPGFASLHFAALPRSLPRPDGATTDSVVTITDANGNGSQDVVWSTPSGIWVQDLAGATTAGMLVTVDNGLGRVTRVQYESSAMLSIDAELAGDPWQIKLPVATPVPTRSETDVGLGAPLRITELSVRDGFWDGNERRLGGFLRGLTRAVAADPTRTLVVETRFHQGLGEERVLRGKPWFTKRSSGAGAVFDVVHQRWEAVTVDGVSAGDPLGRRAAVRSVSTYTYEGTSAAAETRVDNSFDGEGRTIEERHLGIVDVAGDEKIVRRVYFNDNVTRVRDVVCQETVLEGDGQTKVSDTRRFYGDSTQVLPFGSVGKGWVRLEQAWLQTPAGVVGWIDQVATSYDLLGNPTSITESGVIRTFVWDPMGLFLRTETLPGPSPALSWSGTWDQVLGLIRTVTDPNGDTSTIGYDTLGRPTTVSINEAPAHLCYAYDWTAPMPRTTTSTFDGTVAELPAGGACVGPLWRSTTEAHNGGGESLYETTPIGGQFIVSGWNERDERGAVVRTAEAFYSPGAAPAGPVPGTRITLATHDALGRVRVRTLPNGATKSVVYTPLGETHTMSGLAPVSHTFDGLSRLVLTERDKGTSAAESVSVSFDAADRITAFSLQGGQVIHTYGYDTLGRMLHANDPDVGERRLVFNDTDDLIQYTNGEGQSIFFDYDAVGRLTRRGPTAVPAVATDYSFTYDDPVAAQGPGCRVASRLAAAKEPNGDVHFCYDMFGREIGNVRTINVPDAAPATGGSTKSFGLSGLLLSETFDDGFATFHQYDAAGRPTAISTTSGPLWVADTIDATGRVVNEHYGNGATQTYEYDALGLASHVKVDGASGTLYEVLVQRTEFGAPKIVMDQHNPEQDPNHNATFDYDRAGRLTEGTLGSGAEQYAFKFRYNVLQNMTFRSVCKTATPGGACLPADIGVLTGTYRYGERGYGPRQLTSVVPGGPP